MTALSNYLENALINHVLRNTAYTTPGTSIYVALFTNAGTEDNTSTEVTGGAYARQQVTAWDAPTNGSTQNTSDIAYATATASYQVISVGIMDASTSGSLLFYGNLSTSKIVASGDVFKFTASSLKVSLS